MVLRPLKYSVSTFKFSKLSIWYYDHSNMVLPKILKKYLYTIKFILNSNRTLLFQKGLILIVLLFRKDLYYRRDYELKTILIFEGTLNRKRDYDLKNTFNFEGTKKGNEEKKDSSTQVKKGRREKGFPTTQ